MLGSVCLSSKAVLRAGAGLVTVAADKTSAVVLQTKLNEPMVLVLSGKNLFSMKALNQIKEFISKKGSVLTFGMGLGRSISLPKQIKKIISFTSKPMVIDADGINALDLSFLSKQKKKIILTPHLGEFSRLINKDISYIKLNRKKLAKEFAFRYNLVLVLKGHRTLVTDGRNIFENTTGNPGMATAGSGDVLTGIISGFIAQGLDLFDASVLGVYLHGLSADLAVKDKTDVSLIATDIIDYLPEAIKKLKRMPA